MSTITMNSSSMLVKPVFINKKSADDEYRLELIEIMVKDYNIARAMATRMVSSEQGLRTAAKKYDV